MKNKRLHSDFIIVSVVSNICAKNEWAGAATQPKLHGKQGTSEKSTMDDGVVR